MAKKKNKRYPGAMRLLYNTKRLQRMAFDTHPYQFFPQTYSPGHMEVYEDVVKRKMRKLLQSQVKTGWMVQVYNGEDYVHHTSYYSRAAAWKAAETVAFNSKHGYALVVNKQVPKDAPFRDRIEKVLYRRMSEAPFGQNAVFH